MAINPENKIPTTADKNELFFDRNSNKIAYKDSLGITRIIEKEDGVQSVASDGESVVTVDNADAKNPIVGFAGVNVDGLTITGNGRKSNPLVAAYQAPAVDGVTITGDGTPGNPLVAASSGGGTVYYANVIFVDQANGNNATAAQNDFTKPYQDTNPAMNAAALLFPSATARTLIYVRRGTYGSFINLQSYTDYYCEPGVVFQNVSVLDNTNTVDTRFMGKAIFTGYGSQGGGSILKCNGPASKILFEFDEINTTGGALDIGGGASVTVNGRKIYSETFNKGFGISIRTNSTATVIINISEKILAWHQTILFKNLGSKCVINCPIIAIGTGNYYGGNYKQVVQCADNNVGGECIINGDLVNEDTGGYYGGISGMIGRWTASDNMTLRLNGNIYAGDYWGYYALASTSLSKTIINGDIKTNHLVGYASNSSQVVIRNGHLINTKSYSAATAYPVTSMGGSSVVYFENCTAYGFGAVTGFTNKDTAGCTLVVTNMMYSNADGLGYFVVNSASGTPVNNVRLNNVRSKVPNDTNITDLLSPTGFIADANTLTPNFL